MSSFLHFEPFFFPSLHLTCKTRRSTRVNLLTRLWPPHLHTCSRWALGRAITALGCFSLASSPIPRTLLGDFLPYADSPRSPAQSSTAELHSSPRAWTPPRHLALHMIGLIYSHSLWKVLHSKGPDTNTHITPGYFTLYRAPLPVCSSGSRQEPYNIGLYL